MMKLFEDLQREFCDLGRNRNGRNVKMQCWNCEEDGHAHRNCLMYDNGGNKVPGTKNPFLKVFKISFLS